MESLLGGTGSLMAHLLHSLAWSVLSPHDLDEGFFTRFLSSPGGVHFVLLPVFLRQESIGIGVLSSWQFTRIGFDLWSKSSLVADARRSNRKRMG